MSWFEKKKLEVSGKIGVETKVWDWSGLWGSYVIGDHCTIGRGVEIGDGVVIGSSCKIGAGVFIPPGVRIGHGVFIGPNAVFTNDKYPKSYGDWDLTKTFVRNRVSIGANATILCGVELGENCVVGAGAVVTRDVPPASVVVGNPARLVSTKEVRKSWKGYLSLSKDKNFVITPTIAPGTNLTKELKDFVGRWVVVDVKDCEEGTFR